MVNLESYDLDTLRKLIRTLQAENKTLRELLAEKHVITEASSVFQQESSPPDDHDPDQASRIVPFPVDDDLARRFYGMFWGRTDVFAKRGKKGGYFPQCENRWDDARCPKQRGEKHSCDDCGNRKWEPLKLWRIRQHLLGEREDCADVIGIYPLFPDQTCRFLVFDFDNHEKGADQSDNANNDDAWMDEVNALRLICQQNGIDALTERSRSGRGAHVWIFFRHPVNSALARTFGLSLLDRSCESINLTSFRFYDRMYPAQDYSAGLGNLVALPLQGQALKQGNSAFVDEAWNAFPDQLEVLFHTKRLSENEIRRYLDQWTRERTGQAVFPYASSSGERTKPWKRNEPFRAADVTGTLHIVLADGVSRHVDRRHCGRPMGLFRAQYHP